MKSALFVLPSKDMNFIEAIDYALELGVDALEPYPHAELIEPNLAACAPIRRKAEEKGLPMCCFSMMGNLACEDVKAEIIRLQRYADVAAALGCEYLHHTLAPGLTLPGPGERFPELCRRVALAAREVFDYAEQAGVRCVYEDQGYAFNGCERFEAFLGELNRDAGVVADFGNILFVGEKIEDFIGRFAPFIVHAHVKDYIFKPGGGDFPGEEWYMTRGGDYLRGTVVGHGAVNTGKALSQLARFGFDGYCSLEYDGLEDARLAHKMSLSNLKRFSSGAAVGGTDVHLK